MKPPNDGTTRFAMKVPVALRSAAGITPGTLVTLSGHGAFVGCALPLDGQVELSLSIGRQRHLIATGDVVFRVGARDAARRGMCPGIGIHFPEVVDSHRIVASLASLCERHASPKARRNVARPTARMLPPVLESLRVASTTVTDDRPQLVGSLAEIDVASLLTMLEQSRKTARLTLSHGHAVVMIDIVEGWLVDAHSDAFAGPSDEILFAVLAWSDGRFELTSACALGNGMTPPRTITQLLLAAHRACDDADGS